MCEYFQDWVEHYYRPATNLEDEQDIERAGNAIYKFKFVLHHHDPAYRPAEGEATQVKAWHNRDLNIQWTEAAQLQVLAAPAAEQRAFRQRVDERAAVAGFGIIPPSVLQRSR